jgi:hypothetical protein
MKAIAVFLLIGLETFLAATAIYGAIWVVPAQPRALLEGSPFSDYTIPALALGSVGAGAALAAVLVLVRRTPGLRLSIAIGAAIMVFELVETAVIGLDVWLHAVGVGPAVAVERLGNLEGIPAPLGIPLPLWLQPFYVIVGLVIVLLAVSLSQISISIRPGQPPLRVTQMEHGESASLSVGPVHSNRSTLVGQSESV